MEYLSHIRWDEKQQKDVGQTTRTHLFGVMKYAGYFAEGMHLSRLAQLTGILHDMGKMCHKFVDYLWDSYRQPQNRFKQERIDHSAVGAQYLWNQYGQTGSDFERLTCEWAAMVIMSHHAGLYDFLSEEGKSPFVDRLSKELEHYEEAKANFFAEVMTKRQLDELFYGAVQETEVLCRRINDATAKRDDCDEAFCFYRGMAIKYLFSVLIDADRLQTANFMYDTEVEKGGDVQELWSKFANKLENELENFPASNNPQQQKILDMRKEISDACLSSAERRPDFFALSVPTGSGKTLASMRFALAHAKKYKKQRILVVIPYTSIIDQNADEIRKVFQLEQSNEEILEYHSNIWADVDWKEKADEEQKKTKPQNKNSFTETEPTDYSEASVKRRAMTERWDVPIIFTTQVQFLNTLFAGGTKSLRRLHTLENSVVIFDEIQTLPVKCTYLFNEAMNFLKDFAKVTAVLCTATQPELGKLRVPLDKKENAEIVKNLSDIYTVFQRVQIEKICVPGGHTSEELAENIWQDAVKRGNVLCIVNTTASARRIYKSLQAYAKGRGEIIELVHLSTKLCSAHRKSILNRIRECLDNSVRLICVSTQLIEAGVNVSFTTVYRALAGFASIAQAAGRCNRHGELDYGLVKIFGLEHERLDKLEDIRRGKDVAARLLDSYPAAKILQPSVMAEYFKKYYQACRDSLMAYPTFEYGTLYDLLAMNAMGETRMAERGNQVELDDFQAFRSAGKEFCVIDSCTFSVLAPYGEGKRFIKELSEKNYEKKGFYNNMKELQRYMVNLFSYEIRALTEAGIIRETQSGVLILEEKAYDASLGVALDKNFDELLCF